MASNIKSFEARLRRLEKSGGGNSFKRYVQSLSIEVLGAVCAANAIEAQAILDGRDPEDSWDEQVRLVMDLLDWSTVEANALLIKRDSFSDFADESPEFSRMSNEEIAAWLTNSLKEIADTSYLDLHP